MKDKKFLEKVIKIAFFSVQIVLFVCITIYFLVNGRGFGLRNLFWFIVFSMPICIIFGIVSLTIDKKVKK